MLEICTNDRITMSRWAKRTQVVLCCLLATLFSPAFTAELTADQAERIAEEAYIYAYPMLQNYKTMYFRSIAGRNGNPPKPFNVFTHRTKLLGPEYTAIVGPNNDTLYSAVWLDLRREPIVVSVPAVPASRYYSLQFIDAYSHNFAYIGQRATGSDAGHYLIYGPGQDPVEHPRIAKAFASESDFVFVIGRTLVDGEEDIPNITAIQDQYLITPLSSFAGFPAPSLPKAISFPVYDSEKARSRDFVEYFNFLLSFVQIHPSDHELFDRFRKIGIGSQDRHDALADDILCAIDDGVESALQKIQKESLLIGTQTNGWNTTFAGFGSRQSTQSQRLVRASAALIALYGNNKEENSGFSRSLDSSGQALDGSKGKYSVTFEKDNLPPTNAFWSLTMYKLPDIQLTGNNINRYSIGDRTRNLEFNQDGSLTIHLQYQAPDETRDSNWLPAPNGPFLLSLRIYLPKDDVLDGSWTPPQITETK